MILCCGEALIDMIPSPTDSGRDGFVPHSGGAVFNTAIALGRLGVRTGMLTGVSTDVFGQQLSAALAASHVDTAHIITSDRPTTLAFVQLTDGHATYSFFDENSAGRMLAPDDMPELSSEVSALYFGGISLACEPGADAYLALLEREGDTRVVMIDPNIRPGFIADEPRYRARLDRMIRKSDILKMSDEDLNWIVSEPLSLNEKVEKMLEMGPALLILTRGGAGATGFLSDGTEVNVSAQRVEIVDTVGAGDTFNAGVMAKLSELGLLSKPALSGLSAQDASAALGFGARVAAVTVSRAGANPPWAGEVAGGD
ncbi:carbohydrate kinase family protein [Phaeobacter marinintestinus]|uniref:carbohydrate kinase family protein n=1 Tax=Falsiphaeobacter marinintestinus TaxID=1492905 RepID=UPI0011B70841|nr:carbohydrate kinase [Phaeobacter marinintestinus]